MEDIDDWVKKRVCDRVVELVLRQAEADYANGEFPKLNMDAAMQQALTETTAFLKLLMSEMDKEKEKRDGHPV